MSNSPEKPNQFDNQSGHDLSDDDFAKELSRIKLEYSGLIDENKKNMTGKDNILNNKTNNMENEKIENKKMNMDSVKQKSNTAEIDDKKLELGSTDEPKPIEGEVRNENNQKNNIDQKDNHEELTEKSDSNKLPKSEKDNIEKEMIFAEKPITDEPVKSEKAVTDNKPENSVSLEEVSSVKPEVKKTNNITENKPDPEAPTEKAEGPSETPKLEEEKSTDKNQIEKIRKSRAERIETERPKTLWQKSLRIGKKILGNNAVKIALGTTAAVAAVSVGGLGIVLTPLLFTAGVKYGVEGVVGLAQRHLFGGRKLENQVNDLNSKLEQNLSILKQFEQSNDQVFGKTKQIVEQEIKILNLNTEYIEANQKLVKWSKKHAFIRSIIGTVSTLGVGMVGGIPLGMQNFDGDSVKHMVRFSIRGFEYILNSGELELVNTAKNIFPFHTATSWGQVSHVLNWKSAFGAPNMWSLLGLGLSAGNMIYDNVKKGTRYFQSQNSSKNSDGENLNIREMIGDKKNETQSGAEKVKKTSERKCSPCEIQLIVNEVNSPNNNNPNNIEGKATNPDKNEEYKKAEETTTTNKSTPEIKKIESVNKEKEERDNSENKVEKEGIVKEEIPVESVEPIVFDSEFDDIKTFVHDIKNQRLVQGKRLAETEIYLEEIKSLDNTSYIADGIKNVCRKEIIKILEGGKKFDLKKYQQDWEKAFHVLDRKEYWDKLMLEINNSKSIELILFASPDKLYVPKNTESDYEFIDQLKKNIEIAKQIKEYKDDEIMVIIKNDTNFYEGILKTVTQEFQEINKLYMNKNAELKDYIEKIKNKKHPVRMLKNKILNLFTTEVFPNSTIGKKNLKKYYQHIIKSNNKKSIAFTKFDMIEFKYTENEIIDRYLILSKTFETLYKENNDLNNEETNKVRNEATKEIIHLIREKDEKDIVKFLRDNLFEVFRLIRLSDRDKIVTDIKSMTDIDPDKLSAVMNVVQDSYNKVLDRTQDPDGKNQPIKL
jgi:hypothetical protein